MGRRGRKIGILVVAGVLVAGLLPLVAPAAEREHIILVKRWDVVDPDDLTIARGDRVVWLNTTGMGFALIFDRVPGAPETPLVIFSAFSARFDRPGTFQYIVTGMPGPRGASLRRPDGRPAIVPVAAGSGFGWITVK